MVSTSNLRVVFQDGLNQQHYCDCGAIRDGEKLQKCCLWDRRYRRCWEAFRS